MSFTKRYYPRRPIKSFQDLEVYQKTLGLAVAIVKRLKNTPQMEKRKIALETNREIARKLIKTTLRVPRLIATAHSLRFGQPQGAINTLEKAMLGCNLSVVYLEQFRDLVNQKIEAEYFQEQIKEYLRVRGKIMRLQKSWIRFNTKGATGVFKGSGTGIMNKRCYQNKDSSIGGKEK